MSFHDDVLTQLFRKPPYPDTDFSGKTVIVTGANIGLGKEAAKHFVRLKAEKVILAVRSLSKGESAKAEIEAETKRTGVAEVWELDLSSYASVKAFAANVAKLPRVDAAVLNASIATQKFEVFEDNESTITVNVVSTILLSLLLLPTLRASATKWNIVPVLTITSSGVHTWTSFEERKTPNFFDTLNNEKTAAMKDRYAVSKLLQVFAAREIAEKVTKDKKKPFVIVSTINPGLCKTSLDRNATGITKIQITVFRALMAWTAEEGSRTLVHATIAGPDSHGVFLSGCQIENNGLGSLVSGPEGDKTQKEVWSKLAAKLEAIQPGITAEI